jgi:hypothetical protein
MKGHSALQALQLEIDEVLQINQEISTCYTEVVHENVRLRSVVSAQRDDIRALEQIISTQADVLHEATAASPCLGQ